MRFPPLGRLSPIGSSVTRRRPRVIVDPYSDYLLYETYGGTVGPLIGHVPEKGPVSQASGGAVNTMIAGGGRLTQNADTYPDGGAGYDFRDLGQVARKVTADWDWTDGEVTLPPTIAICQSTLPTDNFLHGEGGTNTCLIRLGIPGTPGGNFIMPAWSLWSAAYELAAAVPSRIELHHDGASRAAMLMFKNGVEVGRQECWDPDIASVLGNLVFDETFNTKLGYTKFTAQAVSDYVFLPEPDHLILDKNTGDGVNTPTGFGVNALGGTVTLEGDEIHVEGVSTFQGCQVPIGAVNVGDKLHISLDVTEVATGIAGWAIVNNGGGTVLNDGGFPPAGTGWYGMAPDAGRKQQLMTITAAEPNAALLIGSTDAALSLKFKRAIITKNPPTEFA